MATRTKEKQLIYSEIESTVHVVDGDPETLIDGSEYQPHSSKILLPGETLDLDKVPSYMLQLIKDKRAPGLLILDESEVARLNEFAKLARGEAQIGDFANSPEETTEVPENIV